MDSKDSVIRAYEQSIPWAQALSQVESQLWLVPMAPEAWSIGGCIAHLTAWDRYVVSERLPRIRAGAQLPHRPEENAFNAQAAAYARSGISPEALIGEFVTVRRQLVDRLRETPDDLFHAEFWIEDRPLTLCAYMARLMDHGRAHQEEIVSFLRTVGGTRGK